MFGHIEMRHLAAPVFQVWLGGRGRRRRIRETVRSEIEMPSFLRSP
jgi:hypothetical protein